MRAAFFIGIAVWFGCSGSQTFAAQKTNDYDCLYSRDVDTVIKQCTELIESKANQRADQGKYFKQRANAYRDKRQCDLAKSDLTRAANIGDGKNYEMLLTRALLASECDGETDEALAIYREAIRRFPQEHAAYQNLANMLRVAGKYEEAATTATQGIVAFQAYLETRKRVASQMERNLNDGVLADMYNTRALVWMDTPAYDKAMQDLATGIALNQKDPHLIANRGRLWPMRGDLERSLIDLDRAVAIWPKSAFMLSSRSETHRYAGKFDLAIADADAAILNVPDFAYAYVMRGLANERLGKASEAKADFEKSLTFKSYVYDTTPMGQATASARLAAIQSGVDSPTIAPVPIKSGANSVPTPDVVVPTVKQTMTVARGRRIALVIGNSAYKSVPALANPQRDAEKIAASLRAIGFDAVTLITDASRDKLLDGLHAFADEAEKADWAMVYYAGHGIEVNGMNYLIPVEARLAADRDVQFEALPLDQVMASVESAKKLKLIVLDACRDNPFTPQMRRAPVPNGATAANSTEGGRIVTRSIGHGLGEVKVSGATLVVYAAKHGQTALDGEGGNSPFAVALVQRIATPNVELFKMFRLVRDDVMEATAGRQEPYTYGSLPGREDFFFVQK